ncbi:MAG: hypothetical protein OES64_07800, partial [Desulfobacteraceae bacterium]|nr:hypothetical protein [Desulfobacteraceae bacterium]
YTKGSFRILDTDPAKKEYFCDGQVFFIDRGLLMGACIESLKSLLSYHTCRLAILKLSAWT